MHVYVYMCSLLLVFICTFSNLFKAEKLPSSINYDGKVNSNQIMQCRFDVMVSVSVAFGSHLHRQLPIQYAKA